MSPNMQAAQQRAHTLVTMILHDDRKGIVDELASLDESALLSTTLALVDLAAWVHHGWSTGAGQDVASSWQQLLAELAAWQEANP